ncbi:MAG: hypothetical protein ACI4L2_04275 [Wujia sp.]
MGKRNKEKEINQENQEIELIPLVEDETPIVENEPPQEENVQVESMQAEAEPSDASELFGAYVTEENKWERKNRIREEKEKKKAEKKRAKYKDVDDETYESMKARPGHVLFGIICILMLISGMALATLGIYRLAIAPAYEKVGESEKNLQVDGIATDGNAEIDSRITVLQGVATPSDLVDTWVEQKFATQTDADVQQPAPEETMQTDETSASE